MQVAKRTGPTDIIARRTIRLLRKYANTYSAPIWRYVAELLERPRRLRIVVNVSKINRYTREGETVVVPGKVLGAGEIKHSVTVAALSFSYTALSKIERAGGRAIHIQRLLEENPRGSNVRIIV